MYKLTTIFVFLCSISFAFGQDSRVHWSSAPVLIPDSEKVAKGTINGIGYTYVSSEAIQFSDEVHRYSGFPASKNIPNQKCIKNTEISSNVIIFEKPVKDPYLLFSSIGSPRIMVPISFDKEFVIEYAEGIYPVNSKVVQGEEGYLIVKIPGVHSSISFNYTVAENYASFMFGASVCKENN